MRFICLTILRNHYGLTLRLGSISKVLVEVRKIFASVSCMCSSENQAISMLSLARLSLMSPQVFKLIDMAAYS